MVALNARTTEKTFCSRMRRAISCEYWAPKSRTTMDWVSTDKCLRSRRKCKGGTGGVASERWTVVNGQWSVRGRRNIAKDEFLWINAASRWRAQCRMLGAFRRLPRPHVCRRRFRSIHHAHIRRQAPHIKKINHSKIQQRHQQHATQNHTCGQHTREG